MRSKSGPQSSAEEHVRESSDRRPVPATGYRIKITRPSTFGATVPNREM